MKFNKIIGIAALILLLSVSAVSADSVAKVGIADDGIRAHLSGTVDMHDYGFEDAQIKTRAPYYPLRIAILISDPQSGETVYANQVTADEDGAYSADFILPFEFGECNLRLYTAYGLIYDGSVSYKDGTVEKFNEIADSGKIEDLSDFMNTYNRFIGIDVSMFSKYTQEEQNRVLGFVMKYAPYATKTDIRMSFSDASFNIGLSTETLTDDEKAKMFNEYMNDLGDDYKGISKFISDNGLGANIISLFNGGGYNSIKEDIYPLALKTFLANNVENMYDLEALFGEDNLFSIPKATFDKYKKSTQHTTFFTSLYGKKDSITTMNNFYKAIESCIPSEIKKEENKKSSGGTTHVSGPSGSTYTPPVTVPDNSANGTNGTNNSAENKFSDLDSYDWAKTAIYELSKSGAISGGGDGRFMPANNITREEFAKIVALSFNIEKSQNDVKAFSDVKADDWFSDSINTLVANNIINGVSDAEFGVGRPITRQDAAAIISRILKTASNDADVKFADDDSIADYAKDGVYALRAGGMISGYEDNTFRPSAFITRAEAAQMIYNVSKLAGEVQTRE